jgi:hypothetical protein
MAIFPPDFIPTKITPRISGNAPYNVHSFDDNFTVRIPKVTFPDMELLCENQGGSIHNVAHVIYYYSDMKGYYYPFNLTETFFKNNTTIVNILKNHFKVENGYSITWYFSSSPEIETMSYNSYNIKFSLRSSRKLLQLSDYVVDSQYVI